MPIAVFLWDFFWCGTPAKSTSSLVFNHEKQFVKQVVSSAFSLNQQLGEVTADIKPIHICCWRQFMPHYLPVTSVCQQSWCWPEVMLSRCIPEGRMRVYIWKSAWADEGLVLCSKETEDWFKTSPATRLIPHLSLKPDLNQQLSGFKPKSLQGMHDSGQDFSLCCPSGPA